MFQIILYKYLNEELITTEHSQVDFHTKNILELGKMNFNEKDTLNTIRSKERLIGAYNDYLLMLLHKKYFNYLKCVLEYHFIVNYTYLKDDVYIDTHFWKYYDKDKIWQINLNEYIYSETKNEILKFLDEVNNIKNLL